MSLDKVRESRAAAEAEYDGLVTGEFTPEAQTRADALKAQIKALSEREAELVEAEQRAAAAAAVTPKPAYDQVARVTSEERTYTARKQYRGEQSYFSDVFRAFKLGDSEARARLDRHGNEVIAEKEIRATNMASYAGLVTPQYLVGLAANVLRNGRPFANACTRLPLPDVGSTFNIPRATTGVSATSVAENSAVSLTDQVWTNVAVPLATISGQAVVSRQSLERGDPGVDQLVTQDLAAAIAAELSRQIYVGTGATNQLSGINGTSGINTATLFGAAATAATFYSKLAGQIAAIAGAGTAVRPSLIVMHPRRWGWLTLQTDSSGRPLITPTANGPYNATGINSFPGGYGQDNTDPSATTGFDVVGSLHGLPVITDASIPTNLGGGSTEDVVFVVDQRHSLLWEENGGVPRVINADQLTATSLNVSIVGYQYAAFTAGRYPAAFGRVGGADATGANGLQAPSY